MKVKETVPVISDIIVVINDVKYKDILCPTIEVSCHCVDSNDENPIFIPITASCEEPYYRMGKSFWNEAFGKRQTNRIVKLCNESVEKYINEMDEDRSRIWTILLKTRHQHNTYCVDKKSKIKPYIHKCMWEMRKRLDVHYEIKWLATDFAVIYELGYRSVENRIKYGEIHMHNVH